MGNWVKTVGGRVVVVVFEFSMWTFGGRVKRAAEPFNNATVATSKPRFLGIKNPD